MCFIHSWVTTLSYSSNWEHFYTTRFSVCIKCHKVMEVPLYKLNEDYSKAPHDGTWWKGLRFSKRKVISNEEASKLMANDNKEKLTNRLSSWETTDGKLFFDCKTMNTEK